MANEKMTAKKGRADMDEELNALRGNLILRYPEAKVVCLMGERAYTDKFALAYGLAKRFAALEKRTLFMECASLDRPAPADWRGSEGPGLMEYLGGKAEDSAIVRHVSPFMDEIPTGATANMSDYISGARLGAFLEAQRREYDYIIVDATAMKERADAAMVASRCDGALLLVEYYGSQCEEAQRVKLDMERNNIRLLGAVATTPEKPAGNLARLLYKLVKKQ